MPSSTEVLFCYDVARIDEWATRTGIPLTSVEALGTNYRRARDWMLMLKNELVAQYGWRESQPVNPKFLFDIELPYPEQPHRAPLHIRLPTHATTFFAPDRRVDWEMIFHNYAFLIMRRTVRPISDILHLLQCLLTGMFQIVMDEDSVRTIRALPPADWIAAHETELARIVGSANQKQLLRAASDNRVAFKCERIPRY
ncbi:hypothetical protein PHLGIDRAFT_347616 [Phlebiopsis gigantea 11061_1 CR5-6]|uniref:Uncharacterized protein n=1 Tax=Phlebiopsis gigantea (strain 11061_1 CR5-6) TaxID=745531 RepID=A0A0C3PQ14_PHLG1|nr:hypothetical protein PHLGIDRAFT_347616 [Phlebiopsis gigantea 11061_1 CR5-6]